MMDAAARASSDVVEEDSEKGPSANAGAKFHRNSGLDRQISDTFFLRFLQRKLAPRLTHIDTLPVTMMINLKQNLHWKVLTSRLLMKYASA